MADAPANRDWESLGVSAALGRSYAADARGFLPLLATVLETVLPTETVVERKGGFFQKDKPVRKVTVALGDESFSLEDTGHGPLLARRTKVVRGIVIKNDEIAVETWVAEVSAAIDSRAGRSESAFMALKELLR